MSKLTSPFYPFSHDRSYAIVPYKRAGKYRLTHNGKTIARSSAISSLILRAVGHRNVANGAHVFTAIPA